MLSIVLHYTLNERYYFSLYIDINHMVIVHNVTKMIMENRFFNFYFLTVDFSLSVKDGIYNFQNI